MEREREIGQIGWVRIGSLIVQVQPMSYRQRKRCLSAAQRDQQVLIVHHVAHVRLLLQFGRLRFQVVRLLRSCKSKQTRTTLVKSTPIHIHNSSTLTSSHRLVALRPPPSRMDRIATHRVRPIHAVQLKVQAARVAHHFAAQIAPPDRCRQSAAVRARHVLRLLLLVVVRLLLVAGRRRRRRRRTIVRRRL